MSATTPYLTDLSRYIEVRDGRPHIRGRRVSVMFVVKASEINHFSVDELAHEFTLSNEQVLAALLYYHEHKSDLDAQDEVDTAESDELNQRYGGQPGQRRA